MFEDAYQYKLIGFEFGEDNTRFTFLPQHEIEIEGKKYRLDFALYYSVIKDGKTKVKVKVVIECDGFEHHHTKEQQINDSIRSRQLTLNDWKIYRMTGTEINQNSDISAIKKGLNLTKKGRLVASLYTTLQLSEGFMKNINDGWIFLFDFQIVGRDLWLGYSSVF